MRSMTRKYLTVKCLFSIVKNLSPFTYWLTLDAQYFCMNPDYESRKLGVIRHSYSKLKEGASNISNLFNFE